MDQGGSSPTALIRIPKILKMTLGTQMGCQMTRRDDSSTMKKNKNRYHIPVSRKPVFSLKKSIILNLKKRHQKAPLFRYHKYFIMQKILLSLVRLPQR